MECYKEVNDDDDQHDHLIEERERERDMRKGRNDVKEETRFD